MLTPKTISMPILTAVLLAACSGESGPLDVEKVLQPSQSNSPNIVLDVPEESNGPPFYSNIANGGFVAHDDAWAAIPFQRELACVPPNLNLMLLLETPALFEAWECPLTIEGHEHWEHGPGIDPAPRQTQFRGLGAVPIYFARWDEVEAAIVDGVLTLSELQALPSTILGAATFYRETDVFGISGPQGAGRGSIKINARGTMSNGRSFRLHANEVLGELKVVQISFGS